MGGTARGAIPERRIPEEPSGERRDPHHRILTTGKRSSNGPSNRHASDRHAAPPPPATPTSKEPQFAKASPMPTVAVPATRYANNLGRTPLTNEDTHEIQRTPATLVPNPELFRNALHGRCATLGPQASPDSCSQRSCNKVRTGFESWRRSSAAVSASQQSRKYANRSLTTALFELNKAAKASGRQTSHWIMERARNLTNCTANFHMSVAIAVAYEMSAWMPFAAGVEDELLAAAPLPDERGPESKESKRPNLFNTSDFQRHAKVCRATNQCTPCDHATAYCSTPSGPRKPLISLLCAVRIGRVSSTSRMHRFRRMPSANKRLASNMVWRYFARRFCAEASVFESAFSPADAPGSSIAARWWAKRGMSCSQNSPDFMPM